MHPVPFGTAYPQSFLFAVHPIGQGMSLRYSLKFWVVAIVMGAFLATVVGYYLRRTNAIADGYAQHEVAVLVVSYMEQNGGEWPRNWGALEAQHQSLCGGSGSSSVEYLRRRVFVDFEANVEDVRRQTTEENAPAFDVIHAKTSSFTPFGPANSLVYEYLRKESQVPTRVK